MSIHRHAAKRDNNEGAIRKRFAHHRWHTEQVSAAGMPDLIAVDLRPLLKVRLSCVLVDVKDGNRQPTPAQEKKWAALHALGIPVYVVRTENDVDALVGGELVPWRPEENDMRRIIQPRLLRGAQKLTTARVTELKAGYAPPRATPVDAAKEAEVFAPAPCPYPTCSGDCEHGKP